MPAIIHRVVSEPMDGVMDVQSGRISAGPECGDGGWPERASWGGEWSPEGTTNLVVNPLC